LLAGVCARIAGALGWNVWALRALFVVFLLVKTLWAVAVYAALALFLHFRPGRGSSESADDSLSSPELSARNRRIADLERRFQDLNERS